MKCFLCEKRDDNTGIGYSWSILSHINTIINQYHICKKCKHHTYKDTEELILKIEEKILIEL